MKGDQDKSKALKEKPRQIKASAIFQGQKEVSILFRNEIYKLRITQNDKLILTK